MNPYQVVKDFEQALCDFTGARFAATVDSTTNALLLAVKYKVITEPCPKPIVICPAHTYIGVPLSIYHSGAQVHFNDWEWTGEYGLGYTNVIDSARSFFRGMYQAASKMAVSFHWTKPLGIGRVGAILHDNPEFDDWVRKMRFDGRTEGKSPFNESVIVAGYHFYMTPELAAAGLIRLSSIGDGKREGSWKDYPDLSKMQFVNS